MFSRKTKWSKSRYREKMNKLIVLIDFYVKNVKDIISVTDDEFTCHIDYNDEDGFKEIENHKMAFVTEFNHLT